MKGSISYYPHLSRIITGNLLGSAPLPRATRSHQYILEKDEWTGCTYIVQEHCTRIMPWSLQWSTKGSKEDTIKLPESQGDHHKWSIVKGLWKCQAIPMSYPDPNSQRPCQEKEEEKVSSKQVPYY